MPGMLCRERRLHPHLRAFRLASAGSRSGNPCHRCHLAAIGLHKRTTMGRLNEWVPNLVWSKLATPSPTGRTLPGGRPRAKAPTSEQILARPSASRSRTCALARFLQEPRAVALLRHHGVLERRGSQSRQPRVRRGMILLGVPRVPEKLRTGPVVLGGYCERPYQRPHTIIVALARSARAPSGVPTYNRAGVAASV